jgi:hypothetical protein
MILTLVVSPLEFKVFVEAKKSSNLRELARQVENDEFESHSQNGIDRPLILERLDLKPLEVSC